MDGENIKCPCKKCDNVPFLDPWEVRTHIGKNGFVKNYYLWKFQGETLIPSTSNEPKSDPQYNTYMDMIFDASSPEFNIEPTEEPPKSQAQYLYDMLKAANKELCPGCQKYSQLSLVARLMSLKS